MSLITLRSSDEENSLFVLVFVLKIDSLIDLPQSLDNVESMLIS
jgi:hypothetical protein